MRNKAPLIDSKRKLDEIDFIANFLLLQIVKKLVGKKRDTTRTGFFYETPYEAIVL